MSEVLTDVGGPQWAPGAGQRLQMVRSRLCSALTADVAPLWRAWKPPRSTGMAGPLRLRSSSPAGSWPLWLLRSPRTDCGLRSMSEVLTDVGDPQRAS